MSTCRTCGGTGTIPDPKPVDPGQPCEGFAWIGQALSSCDECGFPYWEHTHDRQHDRTKGLFAPDSSVLVPITPDEAERVRAAWGGAR